MTLASALLVASAPSNNIEADDIRFSQYNSQANDIANTMQKQEARTLEMDLEPSKKGEKIHKLIVQEYLEEGNHEEIAEKYTEDYRYNTEIYIDQGSGLEQVYSQDDLQNTASVTITVGLEEPVKMAVVVGE